MNGFDEAALLALAIGGRGAFRRFRDMLHRWPDLVERWYSYSEGRRIGRRASGWPMPATRPADAR